MVATYSDLREEFIDFGISPLDSATSQVSTNSPMTGGSSSVTPSLPVSPYLSLNQGGTSNLGSPYDLPSVNPISPRSSLVSEDMASLSLADIHESLPSSSKPGPKPKTRAPPRKRNRRQPKNAAERKVKRDKGNAAVRKHRKKIKDNIESLQIEIKTLKGMNNQKDLQLQRYTRKIDVFIDNLVRTDLPLSVFDDFYHLLSGIERGNVNH